jgi:tripartite-type tricarboxylate transporter receptor subunit TctC
VDLLGGQVDFTVDLGAAIPHVKSGKLRLLAVPGKTRSPTFPDAPTLIESGVNVDLVWISGVYAPTGTPQPIVARLNKEIARIMQSPDAKAQLDAMAAEVVPAMTPEQFAAHQQRARDRFGEVVRRAGIKDDPELYRSKSRVPPFHCVRSEGLPKRNAGCLTGRQRKGGT